MQVRGDGLEMVEMGEKIMDEDGVSLAKLVRFAIFDEVS